MAQHNEIGLWGEQTAALHLMHQDYQILERNWRCRHLEIDIIAEYLGEIVFVEVKTRSGGDFREARAAVDFYKRKHIMDAAQVYLRQNRLDNIWRYDVITLSSSSLHETNIIDDTEIHNSIIKRCLILIFIDSKIIINNRV